MTGVPGRYHHSPLWRVWWLTSGLVVAGMLILGHYEKYSDTWALYLGVVVAALLAVPVTAEALRTLRGPDPVCRGSGSVAARGGLVTRDGGLMPVWNSSLNAVAAAFAAHIPADAIPVIAAQSGLVMAQLRSSTTPSIFWHNVFDRALDQGRDETVVLAGLEWTNAPAAHKAVANYLAHRDR